MQSRTSCWASVIRAGFQRVRSWSASSPADSEESSVGKGTDLNAHTPDDLRAIEHRINAMSRHSLHGSTADYLYTAAVSMAD
jgi:hypothetical protein